MVFVGFSFFPFLSSFIIFFVAMHRLVDAHKMAYNALSQRMTKKERNVSTSDLCRTHIHPRSDLLVCLLDCSNHLFVQLHLSLIWLSACMCVRVCERVRILNYVPEYLTITKWFKPVDTNECKNRERTREKKCWENLWLKSTEKAIPHVHNSNGAIFLRIFFRLIRETKL